MNGPRQVPLRIAWLPGATLLLACVWLLLAAWPRSALIEPAASHRLLDHQGQWLAEVGGPAAGEYGYWALETVPERVALATLALEDARFERHPGVDGLAAVRALVQNLSCRCVRSGASTLAMQTVRLQDPRPRTLRGKLVEAVAAVLMTARHGREAVMQQYLRLVPYGNGSHGIAHAARYYLDKPVEDLSWAEIALLSAVPRAPARNNPLTADGHARAVRRAQRILAYLQQEAVIDQADLDLARRQLPALRLRPPGRRPAAAMHWVLEWQQRLERAPEDGGLVYTTLDLDLQHRLDATARGWMNAQYEGGAQQLTLMVVERETMAVRALVGSADYRGDSAGAMDFSRIARSPGSVIKPLLFAMALDRGDIQADTLLWDEPLEAPGVRNADRLHLGPLLPRQALANSRNVPAVSLVHQMGLEASYEFLREAGLHDSTRAARHYGAGLAIGTLPMRLRDVVQAYGMLANDGWLMPLRLREDQPVSGQKIIGEVASRQVTQMLADPMVRLPSFARMSALEYPWPVAVKTGTSQDVRDAWTVAYSSRYLVGAWMGRPDGRGMHRELRGLRTAELVQAALLELHGSEGRHASAFPRPPGHEQVSLCAQPTGNGHCPHRISEWLPADRTRRTPSPQTVTLPPLSDHQPARLRIAEPADGSVYYRHPDTPEDLQYVPVRLAGEVPGPQVLWHVDGRPFRLLPADEPLHLPMQPGRFRVHAELPWRPEQSAMVTITVR
ncbi:transglycosylase domain-containing protein [Wenzhouxiangella sp. AB-CW3]|uniref:transglycosylase domain-containing protein n=1 Tax=Wenzhouxiangella sp. AB-CW3 TaxID=2771012 RepID=UPI00168B06FF|nr:transglycosylase domain-containing protein [Wenzhouxiangella sp. AB-CW3]QOC22801.1 transglycosylase domain-containing protein [Wenzhouxiangella sp. AB-CW3]